MVATSVLAEAVVSGVLIGIFYALVASGFSMIWASMKMVNVAHAVLMVLGSYVAVALTNRFGFDVFLNLLVVIPLLLVVGGAIYRFVLSYSYEAENFELVSIVATFGLAVVLENVLLFLFGPESKGIDSAYSGEFIVAGITISRLDVLAAVIALVSTFALYFLIYRTSLGRAVRAAWQDESLALLHGIDPSRARLVMFALATSLAGVAGVLLPIVRGVTPAVHWDYIVIVFIIVIVGGVGSIAGTLVTGMALGLINEVFPLFMPTSWVPVLLYLILIGFLLIKPEGIFEGVV